jgi:RNA-directed DNA polymerase
MEKGILKKWLKAGFIEKNVLKPTQEGTPQGGICSPVLANLALDGLEKMLMKKFSNTTSASRKARSMVHLVRYADDVRHLTH